MFGDLYFRYVDSNLSSHLEDFRNYADTLEEEMMTGGLHRVSQGKLETIMENLSNIRQDLLRITHYSLSEVSSDLADDIQDIINDVIQFCDSRIYTIKEMYGNLLLGRKVCHIA
jgi:hypothetical protein